MILKQKKPGEAATSSRLGPTNTSQKDFGMNATENSSIHTEVQNLTIVELSTLSIATRRMLETLEAITSVPRCRDSAPVSALLDDELDRLGARLDLIALEIIKRAPANESEKTERYFALTLAASANRMTLDEFIEFHQDGEPS